MTDIDYDLEFLEDGKTIKPISIGLVGPDSSYYAVFADFDGICGAINVAALTSPWVVDNVFPHLPIHQIDLGDNIPHWDWDRNHPEHPAVKTRRQIRDEVAQFILSHEDPALWAWCGAYDHVALCQMWGRMIDKPDGIPNHTNDLQTLLDMGGIADHALPNQTNLARHARVHHALDDARYQRHIRESMPWYPQRWVTIPPPAVSDGSVALDIIDQAILQPKLTD